MKDRKPPRHFSSTKQALLYVMSAAYVLAGLNHFINPEMYLRIIPRVIPFAQFVNQITGVAEIVLGFLLLLRTSRSIAAWGIILLLIAVLPANIKMAHDYTIQHHSLTWAAWLRLPLQGLLIWWAYIYTGRYNQRRRV